VHILCFFRPLLDFPASQRMSSWVDTAAVLTMLLSLSRSPRSFSPSLPIYVRRERVGVQASREEILAELKRLHAFEVPGLHGRGRAQRGGRDRAQCLPFANRLTLLSLASRGVQVVSSRC